MKTELLLEPTGPSKRKIRKHKGRWSPADKSIYAEALNVRIALLRAEDIWREAALKEKCGALEKVLLEMAERCRESRSKVGGTNDHFAHAKTLMDNRRLARERRDKHETAKLSKDIQKEVRRGMKAKKREQVD